MLDDWCQLLLPDRDLILTVSVRVVDILFPLSHKISGNPFESAQRFLPKAAPVGQYEKSRSTRL